MKPTCLRRKELRTIQKVGSPAGPSTHHARRGRARPCLQRSRIPPQGSYRTMSAAPGTSPLSKQEVVNALDSIPTFNIINGENMIVGVKDEHGEEAVRWYLDPDEAESALVAAQLAVGDAMSLRLAVTSLGTSFALCEKWQECPAKLPLKLHASRTVVAGLAEELGATAEAGTFPIFSSEELSSARVMPFFLSRQGTCLMQTRTNNCYSLSYDAIACPLLCCATQTLRRRGWPRVDQPTRYLPSSLSVCLATS